MDELTFRSYAHNRMMFPDVQPERWATIFQNVPAMEERFLKNFIAKVMKEIEVADQATGSAPVIDSLQVGKEGSAECGELPLPEQGTADIGLTADRQPKITSHPLRNEHFALSEGLPVPLGREVSGTVEGHGIRASVCETMQPAALLAENGRSENQASPADQSLPEPFILQQKGGQRLPPRLTLLPKF